MLSINGTEAQQLLPELKVQTWLLFRLIVLTRLFLLPNLTNASGSKSNSAYNSWQLQKTLPVTKCQQLFFFFFQIYQGKNNSTIIFIFCPFAPTTSRSSDVQLYAQRPFNMEFSFSASLLANIPPVFKKEDLWNSPVSITLANHADQPN